MNNVKGAFCLCMVSVLIPFAAHAETFKQAESVQSQTIEAEMQANLSKARTLVLENQLKEEQAQNSLNQMKGYQASPSKTESGSTIELIGINGREGHLVATARVENTIVNLTPNSAVTSSEKVLSIHSNSIVIVNTTTHKQQVINLGESYALPAPIQSSSTQTVAK